MRFQIAVLPGDGIGPEVVAEGIRALEAVGRRFGHTLSFEYGDVGGIAIDRHGTALPQATLDLLQRSDSVLFGAVGGPRWDDPRARVRPEDGLLAVRKGLGLFANLRPVKVFPALIASSPIKAEVLKGVDLVVVRELTGGLYFGKPKKQWQTSRGRRAVDTMAYSEKEIERILRVGFELARSRRRKLTSVDKANVLETSRLWRQIAIELSPQYPEVRLEHMLVDTCAMRLVQRPADFDVIVTENTFGDILTDEASTLAGSLGMLPSASLREDRGKGELRYGLYEPIHGSAPDIAGQGKANPIATILSCAFMLRFSFGLEREAEAVEGAVAQALEKGCRTPDIATPGARVLGTTEMGAEIARRV